MIRLYDDQAQLVLLALAYLEHSVEVSSEYLCEYVRKHASLGDMPRDRYYQLQQIAISLQSKVVPEFSDVVNSIQLQRNKDVEHDSDLVETIVAYLGLEHTRNRGLSSGHVDELRKAILLPEELRKFKEKLQTNELECHKCRHRFRDGEMVTAGIDRTGNSLTCIRCRLPMYAVCMKGNPGDAGHEGVAQLDPRDLQRVSRSSCYAHTADAKPGTASPEEVAQRVNRPFGRPTEPPTRRSRIPSIMAEDARRVGRAFTIDEGTPVFSTRLWDGIAVPSIAPTAPEMEDNDDGPDGTENDG